MVMPLVALQGRPSNIGGNFLSGMEMGRRNRLSDDRIKMNNFNQNRLMQRDAIAAEDRQMAAAQAAEQAEEARRMQLIQGTVDYFDNLAPGQERVAWARAAPKLIQKGLLPPEAIEYKDGNMDKMRLALRQAGGTVKEKSAPDYSNIKINEAGQAMGVSGGAYHAIPGGGGFKPSGPATTSVTVNNPQAVQDDAFARARGKSQISQYDETSDRANNAISKIRSVDALLAIDPKTGFGAETAGRVIGALEALGVDTGHLQTLVGQEAFRGEASKLILAAQADQKGPQTESDRAVITSTVGSLGNTQDANRFLLKSIKAESILSVEKSRFMDRYVEDNGNLNGAARKWREHSYNLPMVSSEWKSEQTGLPMFYYEFAQRNQAKGFSESEIKTQWEQMHE